MFAEKNFHKLTLPVTLSILYRNCEDLDCNFSFKNIRIHLFYFRHLKFLVTILIVLKSYGACCQADAQPLSKWNESLKCRSDWKFESFKDTLNGIIIAHSKPIVSCGGIITASISYIELATDTIRVIGYCSEKEFKPGQSVKITSVDWLLKSHGNKFDQSISIGTFLFTNKEFNYITLHRIFAY